MNGAASPGNTDLLFVYGTLRRGCANDLAEALGSITDFLGGAWVRGSLWRAGDYPALVIDPLGGPVVGDLLRLHDPQATLALLDAYEECTPDFTTPWEYRREIIDVTGRHRRLSAWTYVYNWPVDGLALIPSGDWLAR